MNIIEVANVLGVACMNPSEKRRGWLGQQCSLCISYWDSSHSETQSFGLVVYEFECMCLCK